MNPAFSNLRTVAAVAAAVLCVTALSSCGPKNNTLTKQEIADGWELLFNGENLDGWRVYNSPDKSEDWHVVDGCIQAKGEDPSDLYDDIIGAAQGRIALQIHDGGVVKVLWRNFHLTTL